MPRMLTTTDVGVALRDHLEGKTIEALKWGQNDVMPSGDHVDVDFVDVSDPNNPIIHTQGGTFRIRIFKE